MREILFRGKAINRDKGFHRTDYKNGEWVYGLVTQLYDERFEKLPAKFRDIDGINGIEVDYKTISEFTGLTDKNGKKIFEGDIVKISDINENLVCVWEKDNFEYEFQNKTMSFSICGVHQDDIEIIGNIHDNPELLKGE